MAKFDILYIQSRLFPARSRNSYLLASILIISATALRVALEPALRNSQFITLLPVVFAMTVICGMEVGFFAILLSMLCWYFVLVPSFSGSIGAEQLPPMVFFVIYGIANVVFIGAMRAAMARARRLNQTLLTTFEANPDAILLTDREGRIVNVNRRALSLFGKSRESLIGTAVEGLLPERFRRAHVAHRRRFMTEPHLRGMALGLALRGLRADGTEFPADILIGPIDVDGETMVIATVRDLTDQNALAEALAASRRQQAVLEERERAAEELRLWADAFKCAEIGIEISDPVSGLTRFVNPAYAAARGMTVEEAQGRPIEDAYAPEARPLLPDLLATADAAGRVAFESLELRKDGSTFLSQKDIVSVRHADGHVVYRVASSRDITGLRRTEEELRHTQKMEAIGRLAAGVAHDFNNLLQSVMSGLELVLDDVPEGSQAHEFADLALKSAQRGGSLTRHLLAYARKQVLMPQSIDLSVFLPELKALLVRSLGAQIVIDFQIDGRVPPVFADQAQLQTALLNLAINAAHAMPHGGTLLVAAGTRQCESSICVVLAVTDTGCGMDEETLAQATDPFFTTKGLDGSGLGLSMVKGFAEQSRGSFRIASRPGIGTTVELGLPAAADVAKVSAVPKPPKASGRILLVDDASDVLVTTGAFLAKAGFKVIRASGGNEALSLLARGERFDALVTDFAMPGMNGVDLVAESREIQPGLPALVITGFAEVKGQAALPDGVPVLHKPITRLELVKTLQRVLGTARDSKPSHQALSHAASPPAQSPLEPGRV